MLIVKNPLLRTAFFEHPDYGYICVQYKMIDIISHYNGISEKKISDFIQIEKNRQFAIDQPGLFRLFVLNVTDNKFVLVFSFHHAITDGWSMASLISEFTSAYSDGNEIAYQRIIKQECDALLSSQFDKFWRDYLADAPSPADNFRFHPETITDKNIEIGCLMEDTKSRDILLAPKRLGVSPDCIFLASYFKTLSRFCNQSDLVIGLVMNNRLEEMNGDKVFGLHLNTLPLRVLVGNNSAQLTDVLSQQKTELNTYKAYPYSKIRRDILSGNDIYTCAFNYIHFHVMDAQLNSLDTIDIFEKTTIPFTLHVSRHHDRFRISIKALNEFIDHETATYILDYLQHDLHAIIHDLEFSWLSKNDPKYFINWNKKTGVALPKSKPLAEMQQPRNALEKSLCDIWKTVLNISRIGITDNFFELGGDSIRSIRILAKMQEIKFYVSVNDIFKHKTILALVENTNHTVSATHEEYAPFSLIDNATRTTLLVGKKENSIEDIYPASYLQMGMLIESLKAEAEGTYHDVFAYTIHRPFNEGLLLYIFKTLSVKHPLLRTGFLQHADYGYVCVQHTDIDISLHYSGIIQENVVNFIKAEKNNPLEINQPGLFRLFVLNTNESEFTLLFSSHHAIMDGWSVASLISEFTAAYVEGKFITMEKIPLYQRVIQQERLALSSSEFENFWSDYLIDSPQPKRHLIFHPKALVDKNIDMNSALDNTTSAHILSTAKRFSVSPDIIFLTAYFKTLSRFFNQDNLIVGLVMNNRLEEEGGDKVFGLHLNTLPFRMQMIKNSAQLTTQLYEQKTRLNTYKAYPYGKIRTDIMKSANLYTCAFNYIHFHVVAEQLDAKNISPTQVFEKTNIPFTLHVSRHQDIFRITIKALNGFTDHETARYLLDYMEHDLHAIIHDLEFTWLSKDDPENFRNWNIITDTILPKSQIMTEMRQPRNALEKTLCDIWQNVLNVPRIGITDNFFELGGDSIRSIRLLAKMQEIGFHVSVSDIFKYKTILELLEHSNHTVALKSETYTHFSLIDDATSESIKTKNPSIQDIYPASYLQIHMLTDSLKTNAQGTYHDVFAYTIHRSFNEGLLLYIFKMLSVKHPLLRTAFMPNADYGYISAQHEEINIALHYKGIIEENSIDFINGEKNNLITIDQPGLFRLFVLNPMRDQFVLVFSFHHAITDGWSVASLMSEFTAAYASGKFIVMESIPLYQRVIQQERLALTSETHKAFWLEISCVLDSEKSARVLSIAKRLGVSVDIVFLAAYFKTVSQHFNQKNPVIGLVMNNRLEETGGDKVFGLHLNILPLRMPLNISDNDDFILALADERLRLVPHKAYPYEKLCLDLNAPTGFYNFAFNYTHFHINENQTKDKLIDPIYVFEKMSIPLILQISRYQESFRLIIRTNAQFIDEKIAKNMLDFMLDQL
ncbi:MAG: condensation domain-containing protein [Gammaproteobacteria bacterium]|nr:condensation domain-containing protein [Gammaproteobacteria bacterium]